MKALVKVLGVAIAYALVGWFAQFLVTGHVYVCVIWPSAGIALAAVLRLGRWAYLGIAVGSFTANILFFVNRLSFPETVTLGALTATGAVLEAALLQLIIAWRLGREDLLDRFRSQIRFLGWLLIACTVSAAFGVTTAHVFGQLTDDRYAFAYFMWWSGDILGILLLTPFLLTLGRSDPAPSPSDSWWHRSLFVAVFSVLAGLLFFTTERPFTVLLLLGILWTCFFYPPVWAHGITLGLCAIATYATSRGYGPLAVSADPLDRALNLDLFVFVATMTTWTVSGGLRRRIRRAADSLVEKNRQLLESAPVGIAWSNEGENRFAEVNGKLAKILGYSRPAELLQLTDVKSQLYYNPVARQRLLNKLDRAAGADVTDKFEARKRDRTLVWLRVDARRVQREGRQQILGFARDITDGVRRRKQARMVQKVAKRIARGGSHVQWLPKCIRSLGKQLGAEAVTAWLRNDQQTVYSRRFAWARAGGEESLAVHVPMAKDNPVPFAEIAHRWEADHYRADAVSVHALQVTDGTTVFGVLVVVRPDWLYLTHSAKELPPFQVLENTVLRIIGEALGREEAKQALEREEELYRQIARFAKVGMFFAGPDGHTRYSNPEGKILGELDPEEDPDNWRLHLDESNREKVLEAWDEFVRQCSNGVGGIWLMEEVFRKREGGQRVVDVLAQATRADDGTLTGFVGIFKDITDLKVAKHKMDVSLESVSHNTKNGVRALLDVFEQIHQQTASPLARQLIAAGREQLKTIEDLAKIARNPIEPRTERETFDLHAALKSFTVVNLAPPGSTEKRAEVILAASVPERAFGPRAALMQVLQNLLANAANCPDVRRCWVRVTGERSDQNQVAVTFTVEDDGAGLSDLQFVRINRQIWTPELLRTLFSSLVRPEHGLGLPLCQVWLKAIGSELDIQVGENGNWNRFSFTILVEERPPSEALETPVKPQELRNRGPVLLVEDHSLWRLILTQRLLDWGVANLTICERGEDAVQHVCSGKVNYSFVLMDIFLAGQLSGYDAVREIRARTKMLSGQPRMVSISISEDDGKKREEAGFDGFIRKDKLKRPIDLARVWFPAEVSLPEPSPPAEETWHWQWPPDVEACRNFFMAIAAVKGMLHTWGLKENDGPIHRAIHEMRQNYKSTFGRWMKLLDQVKQGPNAEAELANLCEEVLNRLRSEVGVC